MAEPEESDLDRDLKAFADKLSLTEASQVTRLSQSLIRRAIQTGELPATIPRGREPLKAGRGNGYRIGKADLKAWLMGDQALTRKDRIK